MGHRYLITDDVRCKRHGVTRCLRWSDEERTCQVCDSTDVEWVPAMPFVHGTGWFEPGYDIQAGQEFDHVSDLDRWMKSKGKAIDTISEGDTYQEKRFSYPGQGSRATPGDHPGRKNIKETRDKDVRSRQHR